MTQIRLALPLRASVGGAKTVPIEAGTVGELTRQIASRYPALGKLVLDGERFGSFVTVFVDGEDVRYLAADLDIRSAQVVEILPAMSGG